MGSILYNPEEYGVKIVGEYDTLGDYEFSIHLLVVHDGKLLYAYDAGCS